MCLRFQIPAVDMESLPFQVSKAKNDASSLEAKLADATAELRACNSRLTDTSAKVCFYIVETEKEKSQSCVQFVHLVSSRSA